MICLLFVAGKNYTFIAARISVSNLHKQTSKVFSEVVAQLHKHVHPKTGQTSPLVSDELYNIVMQVSFFIIAYDCLYLFVFV